MVLARSFHEVGPWTVVLFIIPILVAHVALVRAEKLYALSQDLQERQRLLELLSDRMAEERKDERLRIASDLHDEVLQDVTRIWMQSKFASQESEDGTQLAEDVRQLVSDTEEALSSLRDVIADLRRSPLGRGGLTQTTEQLVRDLRLDWGKRIEFVPAKRDLSSLAPDIQLVAYQFVREALVNTLKHSQASLVIVTMRSEAQRLEVVVEDNGVGFDAACVDRSQHFGLGLTEERIRMVGGSLKVESEPSSGTILTASLPMRKQGTR